MTCWDLGAGKKLLFSRTSSSLRLFSGMCKGLCTCVHASGLSGMCSILAIHPKLAEVYVTTRRYKKGCELSLSFLQKA